MLRYILSALLSVPIPICTFYIFNSAQRETSEFFDIFSSLNMHTKGKTNSEFSCFSFESGEIP